MSCPAPETRVRAWRCLGPRLRPALALAGLGLVTLVTLVTGACQAQSSHTNADARAEVTPRSRKRRPAPKPEKSPSPASNSPAAPPASEPPAPLPPPDRPKLEDARAIRARLLTELEAGRERARAKDYDGAMVHLREALALDPGHIATLGELGWAAFRAGDLGLARRATVAGLHHAPADAQQGMLLYNLGRIDEAEGELGTAAVRYRRSLTLRPNATVEARLAQVEASLAQAAASGAGSGSGSSLAQDIAAVEDQGLARALHQGLTALERDLPDLDAVCASALRATHCEGEGCACEPALLATPSPDDSSWGLVHVETRVGLIREAYHFPAIQAAGGWTVFASIAYAYNPGSGGVTESVALHPSTLVEALGPDGGTQLWFRVTTQRHDHDMGLNEILSDREELWVLCMRAKAGDRRAACSRPLIREALVERSVLFQELEEADAAKLETHEGLPFTQRYRAELEFAGGSLTVSAVQVEPAPDTPTASTAPTVPAETFDGSLRLGEGRYPILELVGL